MLYLVVPVVGGVNIRVDTILASNTPVPRFTAFRDSGCVKILILSAKANGGIPNGGNYTSTERGDDDATKTFFVLVVAMHAGNSGDRTTLARLPSRTC